MSTICKNTGNRQELPCINCTCESSSSTAELGRFDSRRDLLAPCPFCGRRPRLTVRPDNPEKSMYFAAVACYCGGYSACAHKMATAPEADEAEARACEAWNRRPNTEGEQR